MKDGIKAVLFFLFVAPVIWVFSKLFENKDGKAV